jgi:hypothetical protein
MGLNEGNEKVKRPETRGLNVGTAASAVRSGLARLSGTNHQYRMRLELITRNVAQVAFRHGCERSCPYKGREPFLRHGSAPFSAHNRPERNRLRPPSLSASPEGCL